MEAVVPEARLLPGEFRLHLGYDAAALHHPAKDDAREQCPATHADPRPEQALHQSSGRGEPGRDGRTLRGDHDGIR